MDYNDVLYHTAVLLSECDGLLIGAGAGIGVDSGLPDFRGNKGLWGAYPTLANLGLGFSEIASPRSFTRTPEIAWGFYGHRLNLYRNTIPHDGFRILRQLGEPLKHGYFVYTSNVDGQFQKAGFDPKRVAEIHGTIHELQCLGPCCSQTWSADSYAPVVDTSRCIITSPLPRCEYCDDIVRPNICMFDDPGWVSNKTEHQLTRFRDWKNRVIRPLIIEVGAGVAIPSVRYLSDSWGPPLVRINPSAPEVYKEGHVGVGARALSFLTDLERLHGELHE